MFYLITQIIAVTFSSWLLAKKYFGIKLFSESILVCFILSFAQIILVELFLGIIGRLYFVNVFVFHLLILALILLNFSRKKIPVFTKPDIKFFWNSNLLIFAASVFLSFFLVKVFLNLINPPVDADSLLYHLAFPAAWIKSGTLDTPFFIFGSMPVVIPGSLAVSSPSYFPINAELFFTWFMLPLRNAFLADLGEAPFYFVGIITVYSILRKYNLNQKTALLSGFLLVLIPNIFKQLKAGAQIDVICAVLFLLILFNLLLLKFDFTIKKAILLGIVSGIFIGTKFNNLVWLIAIFPLAFYILWKGIKTKKLKLGKVLIFLGAVVSMAVLFGAYMYIKNYIFTGNPIFPVDLKIFGKVIFKGLVDSHTYKIQLFTKDAANFTRLLREGLGVQFFALIVPGTFIPLFFYRYLRNKISPFTEYLLLFLTPLITLVLFKVFIGVYIARYFFPYLSLGLLTAVIFLNHLQGSDKYFKFIAFVSIVAASFELAHRYELVVSILLSLTLFILLAVYKKQLIAFYNSKSFGKVMLAGLLLGFLFLVYLNNKYDKEEFSRYASGFSKKEAWQIDMGKAWKALNELTKSGAHVAYTGRQEAYPLYGRNLKNNVKYVSVNSKEITPYNKPDGLYRQIKDFVSWKKNLQKDKIDYLFIAKPVFNNREALDPSEFPIEDKWAGEYSENFQLVFDNSLSRIYKVLIK